ncbi:hypothetical protein RYX36_015567, partial [Vicia faba]
IIDKLNGLASKFSSLSEPIDRIKRLLQYASLVPRLDRSDRIPENRVSATTFLDHLYLHNLSVKPSFNNILTSSSSTPSSSQSHGVTNKLNDLAFEFASLSEPID